MKVMPATKSLNQKKKVQSALQMLQNKIKQEVVRKPMRTRLRPKSHDEGTTTKILQQKADKKKMKRIKKMEAENSVGAETKIAESTKMKRIIISPERTKIAKEARKRIREIRIRTEKR